MASMQATAVSDALGPTVAAAAASAVAATTTAPAAPHAAAAVASAAAAAATLPAAADVAQSSQRSRNTRLQSSLNVRSSSFPDPNPPPSLFPYLSPPISELPICHNATRQNKTNAETETAARGLVWGLSSSYHHILEHTHTHTPSTAPCPLG